jgi:hypothetical protein
LIGNLGYSTIIDEQASLLWDAQWRSFLQESNKKQRKRTKFQYHLWDLATLASRLAKYTDDE